MKRFGLLGIGLLLVMGLTFIPAQTTYAQEITCVEYLGGNGMDGPPAAEVELDSFPLDGGFYNSGTDFVEGRNPVGAGDPDVRWASVIINFDDLTEITSATLQSTWTSNTGPFTSAIIYYDDIGDPLAEDPQGGASSGTSDISWSGSMEVDYLLFGGSVYGGNTDLLLTYIEVCGYFDEPPPSDNWTRPLLEADENTVGGLPMWDTPGLVTAIFGSVPTDISTFAAPETQYRVMAMSNAPGAPVLAAQNGTVTNIDPYNGDMCSIWGAILTLGTQCWFSVPTSGSEVMALYQFPITEDLEQVTITIAGGEELRYLVYNASRYVHMNLEVSAGCMLGETIAGEEVQLSQKANIISTIVGEYFSLGGALIGGTEPGFGITFIEERNPGELFEMVPLLPKLTTYNETAYPCNQAPSFQDCLNFDSDLTNFSDNWERVGDVENTEAGLNIRPNSHIQQEEVNLPVGVDFTFRIGLYFDALDLISNPDSLTREVMFRVGDFETTEIIEASGEYQEFVVEVPEPGVDPGGLDYTIRIANTGGPDTGGIIIAAACLTTNDHELNPRACYFQNYEFDTTAGWITTEVQQGNGFIILGNADAVLQEVQLTANEDDSPRTYRLEVDARPIAAPGATLDTDSGSATLYYSWEGVETIGTLDLQWNQAGNPGYPDAYQTFSIDIEVVELSTDDFIIYTGFTDNETVNIALSRVCLSTDTDTPTGGGVPGPFGPTCNTIPVPTEDGIGVWTMYHWRNLDKFFNCKLMVLLNRWFKLFDDFRLTALKFFRWGIAVVNKGVNWSQSLFWWLNGHFRNIATGQVTTITDGGGCHDFFCAIVDVISTLANLLNPVVAALNNIVSVLLGVLVGTVNLFFAIIGGLVAFAVAIIIKLLSLFQLAGALLATIIGAYNSATPTAIPGMPMCGIDVDSSPLCVWVWATDNTIFSGRWGILWAVVLSIAAVHLILWAIGEFKDVLLKTWGSS